MKIHNLFVDLLKATNNYLLNNIFNDLEDIQRVEYNIGNESFLNNISDTTATQIELPALEYNLESVSSDTPHTTAYKTRSWYNINSIPILYNESKNIELRMREDRKIISIDVNLFCRSQLQCLDFAYTLESIIPKDTKLYLFDFISFLSIPNKYLSPCILDVNADIINNLYMYHNRVTNEIEYCFSIKYEPLISISEPSYTYDSQRERSHVINFKMEIHTPFPIKMLSPPNLKFNCVDYSVKKYNTKIHINENYHYFVLNLIHSDNRIDMFTLPIAIKNDKFVDNSLVDNILFRYKNNDYFLKFNITRIKKISNIKFNFNHTKFTDSGIGKILYDYRINKYVVKLTGFNLTGIITNVVIDDINMTIDGVFDGNYDFNYKLKDNIQIEYTIVNEYLEYGDVEITLPSEFYYEQFKTLNNLTIFNSPDLLNLNKHALKIDYNNTIFKTVHLLNINSNEIEIFNVSTNTNKIDEGGAFSFDLINVDIIINGVINIINGNITNILITNNTTTIYDALYFVVDWVFVYNLNSQVDEIESINLNLNNTSPIFIGDSHIPFDNKFSNNNNINIVLKIQDLEFIYNDNNKTYMFSFKNTLNITQLDIDNNKVDYKLYLHDNVVISSTHNIFNVSIETNQQNGTLEFTIDELTYIRHVKNLESMILNLIKNED